MRTIAVLGAGSWGTALAVHLGRLGHHVRLWVRDPVLAGTISVRRANAIYLPDVSLPDSVAVTDSLESALRGSELVVSAIPTHGVRAVIHAAAPFVRAQATVVSATKGLEAGTLHRMSEVIVEELGADRAVVVLSGPSFAAEVAQQLPTVVLAASASAAGIELVQAEFRSPTFRLYGSPDVVGVEIGGALKNVIAIAAGVTESLHLGHNALAALITRGLAEIVRLGTAAGAQAATFAGLAGLGDLVLTCTGTQSRNRALGTEIARGRPLADVEAGTPMVAEGVRTVASVLRMARERGVKMPICEEVAAVLFQGKPVAESLASLLAREPRPEEEGARHA
jgi:glycerol-3-phosphate dehydrogenase (NAD(P)+)